MEHETPYGELALTSPDGQMVHHLDWNTLQPVPLLRNVTRLTAPNPGVMTGPGTNSYLVGDPGTGYIAIDPGPNDPQHVERLWRAAGGDIRMIVCTHSHSDHSPGAPLLQALCRNKPPILGLSSQPTARPESEFTPDRELYDLETLVVEGNGIRHSLKALFTPGHAANHLCLVLVEDGLLFSGDHILNGSTTVINPPDGEMNAYLESLDKLTAACAEHGIGFILPAHGYVIGSAPEAIAFLKAHRLKREAKIMKVMQAHPQGVRSRLAGILARTSTAAVIVAAPIISAVTTPSPPACQASPTGAVETRTAAKPPRATKPMTPTLNSPANPHWRFTPSAMMAEMRPIFTINNAEFQLCENPVIAISAPTRANKPVFLSVSFIPLSP